MLISGVRFLLGVPPRPEEFLIGIGVDMVLSAISCGLSHPALFSNTGSGAVAVAIQAALRRAVAIGAASHVAVLAGSKVFAYARIGGGSGSGADANSGGVPGLIQVVVGVRKVGQVVAGVPAVGQVVAVQAPMAQRNKFPSARRSLGIGVDNLVQTVSHGPAIL